ncbi:DoxX family protein [Candidatus Uhrbacteria bacterium]|nr:DoxX family protein [Candidatus Uhrbacteria bacterium]
MPHSTPFDQFAHATHKGWFSAAGFLLRLGLGVLFVYSAWSKLSVPAWSAAAYLAHATGPFAVWFQSLAGNPVVDVLNLYGQLLIGLALVFGFFVRPASFFGVILMVLYYLSNFATNIEHGLIDEHVMYALVFFVLLSGGFGHVWGLDGVVGRQPSLQSRKWTRWLFG